MASLIREAAIGQIIRYVSGNRLLKYPEEMPDFVIPDYYAVDLAEKVSAEVETPAAVTSDASTEFEAVASAEAGQSSEDLEKQETINQQPTRQTMSRGNTASLKKTKTREETLPFSEDRFEVELAAAIDRAQSTPIIPVVTNKGQILVDWYTTDDESNPQNWPLWKKNFASFIICVYTFVVYSGSAIYTPSTFGVMEAFGVSVPVASLGLALYVLGYGMGPLLFSPLSEIPRFGRNPAYVATYGIFVILCIPTALVNNIGGLLVLRFLQGFFGSPCLATAPATLQDLYSFMKFPYILVVWTSFSFCGPAVGPILAGYAVPVLGWRWSLWEILIMSGPSFVLMFLCMPETSAENILLRRAARLRALTGDDRLRAASEIKQGKVAFKDVVWDALIKPIEITILDPAVLFVNVYTSFIYATYYSFFEAFPIVYSEIYGFNLGETATTFLCILVACIIGVGIYIAYLWFYLEPDVKKNGLRTQEFRLIPALIAVFFPTIGLFIFGWTSRTDIHWIVSIIGITIYACGVFIIFQCIFVYVPMSYPQYAASLFAGNDFCRSALACGSIMFGRPLYINLGIGRGISVLGGCSVLGILGMWALYLIGDKLRARSRFTVKQ